MQTSYQPFIRKHSYWVLFMAGGMRSGSVVECLTRDREAAGLSLTGVTVLCSP